jgi:hypothetical protein
MRTGFVIRALCQFFAVSRPSRRGARPRRPFFGALLQGLETRLLPSGTPSPPTVEMLSASTRDSQGVTIDYRIDPSPQAASLLQFSVYRSSDARLDPSDRLVGTWTSQAGVRVLDAVGQPATSAGVHELTIPLPGGLPPDPRQPYVLVAASNELPGTAPSVAAFRKYMIGIVTHGALINPSWKHGPPWQLQTATWLRRQGYDIVIPFNWASQSSKPGRAAVQGVRLAHQVLVAAGKLPPGSPVDVQFIGHSEGAVVNTQAIVALERAMTPELKAGFLVDTLLDPHAANNHVPGQASAAPGLVGALASALVSRYQASAHDPPAFIPSGVSQAQVFYQHNPASRHSGIYNLWGQVPVPNFSGHPVAYYNLTATGAIHSGNYGVSLWYRNFVAPTLGDGAPLLQTLRLDGWIQDATATAPPSSDALAWRQARAWGPVQALSKSQPTFAGTAAPGSKVRVYVGPSADLTKITTLARTTADPLGRWSATTRPLHDGRYRAVAMSYAPALVSRPGLAIVPMAPLGRFTIGAGPQS